MKKYYVFLVFLVMSAAAWNLSAQSTAFSYQGRLFEGANAANGSYDFTFALFDAGTNGVQSGATLTNWATVVSNGLFDVTLDFGSGIFNGTTFWLAIGVRTNTGGAFTALARQEILPVPYAIYAPNAGLSTAVAAGAVTGASIANSTITATNIASGQVVKSLNGLMDAVVLAAGTNITLRTNGNILTISSTGNLSVATNVTVGATALANKIVDTNTLSISAYLNTGPGWADPNTKGVDWGDPGIVVFGTNGALILASPTEISDGGTRPTIFNLTPTNVLQIGDTFLPPSYGSGGDCGEIRLMATNVNFDQNAIIADNLYFGSSSLVLGTVFVGGTYYSDIGTYFGNTITRIGGFPRGGTLGQEVDIRATNTLVESNLTVNGTSALDGSLILGTNFTFESHILGGVYYYDISSFFANDIFQIGGLIDSGTLGNTVDLRATNTIVEKNLAINGNASIAGVIVSSGGIASTLTNVLSPSANAWSTTVSTLNSGYTNAANYAQEVNVIGTGGSVIFWNKGGIGGVTVAVNPLWTNRISTYGVHFALGTNCGFQIVSGRGVHAQVYAP